MKTLKVFVTVGFFILAGTVLGGPEDSKGELRVEGREESIRRYYQAKCVSGLEQCHRRENRMTSNLRYCQEEQRQAPETFSGTFWQGVLRLFSRNNTGTSEEDYKDRYSATEESWWSCESKFFNCQERINMISTDLEECRQR